MFRTSRRLHLSSRLIHPSSSSSSQHYNSSSFPIYQTSTFQQSSPTSFDTYDYSRSGNPTRDQLQQALAQLEVLDHTEQVHAFAFNSGVSAVSTVLAAFNRVPIIAGNDLYGGSMRLLGEVDRERLQFVDAGNLTSVEECFKNRIVGGGEMFGYRGLFYCESPTNPLMKIVDIEAIAELCSKYEIALCVDNTMMSPLFQKPLELGADIVIHSATKFLNGHGDVTAGVVCTNRSDIAERVKWIQNAHGNALSPFDSWLLLRGLKTLSVRMNQQQKNARLIVAWLCSRFGSENVFYPGLGKDGEIHLSQSSGTGSVISFQVGNEEYAVNFLKSLKLFKNQVSFGSVCSSIEIPWHHSHASVPSAFKSELEFGGDLIRLSVGIEDVQDLIMDLESAAEYCKSPERLGKTVESKGAQKGASRRSFSSSSSPFEKGNSTIAIHGGEHKSSNNFADSLTSPISMSSAFWFKDSQELLEFAKGNHSSFEYGRYGNPTTKALENKLVSLERGSSSLELDCLMSSSGMNSATTMLLSLVPQNGHIITTKDCYRRTRQFISTFLPKMGITHEVIQDTGNLEQLESALQSKKASLFFSESPTNPFLRCVNIPKAAELCKKHGTLFCIDSTFATPINQKPLELGADLVLHSATKYLAGHNDVLAGALIGKTELISSVKQLHNVLGGVLDPFASYLVIRGLKTLKLRVEQQNSTALKLAQFLQDHPMIEVVHYPGLESHPDHAFAKIFMSGFGGVVSFLVKGDLHQTSRFIDSLELPFIAPSLGGVESLVEQPTIISYWDQPPSERSRIGIADNLVRFSCGIEDTEDILADFKNALDKITEPLSGPYLNV